MINVNDHEVNENSNQSDLSDEITARPADTGQTSPSDELSSQPPSADKPAEPAPEYAILPTQFVTSALAR